MPSGNLRGCVHRELRYDTAYALQRRVMEVLSTGQERVFGHGVGHYWTPHSGRNFLPSAAAALNIEKTDRDMLGGWAAQESDRYNRVAKVKIQMIQARVAATFADRITVDPLLETDALEDFSAYLRRQGMSEENCRVSTKNCQQGTLLFSQGQWRKLRWSRLRICPPLKSNSEKKMKFRGNVKQRGGQKDG